MKGLRAALSQAAADPPAAFRRFRRIFRAGLGMARGMLVYHAAWVGMGRSRSDLAAAVSDLLMIGFYGANERAPSARLLARQGQRGEVGGVFFVTQNIGTLQEVTGLLRLFRAGEHQPMIAIDQEGGIVQRLKEAHGMTPLPAAKVVAATMSPVQAREIYATAGQELAALGFNTNFGPVLDIDMPQSPAIGRAKRSFGPDPDLIVPYAEAFVEGFSGAGILCVAKHFPGHGSAMGDSHHGVADISESWNEAELEPFRRLFVSAQAPAMVMMGHLRLDAIASDGLPATISSSIVTGLLRAKMGFRGVIMTDDIDMEAISHLMNRRQAVIASLVAGNDLIMIKNLFGYDPLLPSRVVGWVRDAISRGVLTEERIMASAERVRAVRHRAQRETFHRAGARPSQPPAPRAP